MYTGFDIGINRKAWSAFTGDELERFAAGKPLVERKVNKLF